MRRRFAVIAAGAAAFLLALIARFPARWAEVALPRDVACGQLAGTLWSGTCTRLVAAGAPLGDLAWTLHPWRLLTGRLSLDVAATRGDGTAHARVEIGLSGAVTARAVRGELQLDHSWLSALPPSTHGSADVDLDMLRWNGRRITQIRGRIDLRGLTANGGEPLGDYRLLFPGGPGEPVGQLTDLGGPIAVQGTVHLTREPGYVVQGLIAARPSAAPDLVSALRYLGAPDAQGRRQFSVAGTF